MAYFNETLEDGSIFEGDLEDGTGKGKITYTDGTVYEGDFVEGEYHGKGKLIEGEKAIYEGDFRNGEQTGKGKKIETFDGTHRSIYEGYFVNGKLNGKGKETYGYANLDDMYKIDGNADVYEGDFVNGEKNGKGKCRYTSGTVYEGEWVNDIPNGIGKETKADGTINEGLFKGGKFVGKVQTQAASSSSSAPNSGGSSAMPPPRPAAQPASKQNSKTKGVLVVDYSATMAKIMGRIITSRGMDVVATATDGEQAVKKYKELYPNIELVTLNILIPDMDGVTALKKILEFDKNAKVLMVAPEEGYEDKIKECILTGAKSFVKKPLEENKVLERIAAIMPNI